MRYAMIMAGGSGTRLWPMSRAKLPKQLIPFIAGKSLLQVAMDRLRGLTPGRNILICAGEAHRGAILENIRGASASRYFGEPIGRDTLNAVGLVAAVVAAREPDAAIAVFTADHIIEPVGRFQKLVRRGFQIVQRHPDALVTFGIRPTHPATGYGYLKLGRSLDGARVVEQFAEKPKAALAQRYFRAGPRKYLWNSGMFVWRAGTLLACIRRYKPATHAGLTAIARAWHTRRRAATLRRIYPTLEKISVDFGVMEPASSDPNVKVVAVPMGLSWLDVGSWPAFAATIEKDTSGNALAGGRCVTIHSARNLLASSDPAHVLAVVGCDNLIVVHTPDATLVCSADRAEEIKSLHTLVRERFGTRLV